jgi:oxygen-independent coproporphyrinogen-3 oxidase
MESPVVPRRISSVYVHTPFCAKRCRYCDFPVTAVPTADLAGWLSALRWNLRELEEEGVFVLSPELETLFVGGGTPSFLGPNAMKELAGVLGPGRLRNPDLEWTGEANPDSFSPDVARGWAGAGVNRVSLGIQSFDAGALRWLGRAHGSDQGVRAVETARKAGLGNLSVDLIFGLPRQVGRDWNRDLDRALELDLPHLSLYGLSVEPETPLGWSVAAGTEVAPGEDEYAEEYLLASHRLASEGYLHYEVSNFARPGFEARHNRVYWDRRPYLGLGNGAHSFLPPRRRWNLRDWPAYQGASVSGGAPWEADERLGEDENRLETIWLGLRTDVGLPWEDLAPAARMQAARWISEGKAVRGPETVRLTPPGWLLLDDLALTLDALQDQGGLVADVSESPRGDGARSGRVG